MVDIIVKPPKIETPHIDAIHGHTRIELKDVHTGKRERVESDNIVTTGAQDILEPTLLHFSLNKLRKGNLPKDYREYKYFSLFNELFGGIFLFDKQIPETARYMPAGTKMIGNGSYELSNSGEVTEFGSYNQTESAETKNSFVQVYDYTTAQANGEINSVCLTTAAGGYLGYGNSTSHKCLPSDMFLNRNTLNIYTDKRSDLTDPLYMLGESNTLSFSESDLPGLGSDKTYIPVLCVWGNYLYFTNTKIKNNKVVIYKIPLYIGSLYSRLDLSPYSNIDASTAETIEFTLPVSSSDSENIACFTAGTKTECPNLWIMPSKNFSGTTFYKLNISNGSVTAYPFTFPGKTGDGYNGLNGVLPLGGSSSDWFSQQTSSGLLWRPMFITQDDILYIIPAAADYYYLPLYCIDLKRNRLIKKSSEKFRGGSKMFPVFNDSGLAFINGNNIADLSQDNTIPVYVFNGSFNKDFSSYYIGSETSKNIVYDAVFHRIYFIACGYASSSYDNTRSILSCYELRNPLRLMTINNLSSTITKTAAQTMKVTYTLTME